MANAEAATINMAFDDQLRANCNDQQIELNFGDVNRILTFIHSEGDKRYRSMLFRQAPRFRIKLFGVRQVTFISYSYRILFIDTRQCRRRRR